MPHETSSPAYDNLRDAVLSLGMEISDSILSSLADSVALCRRQNENRLETVDPILLGIEAVGNHIDSARALSEPRAFSLLHDLLDTYKQVTDDTLNDKKSREKTFGTLQKVLEWQQHCFLQAKENSVTDQPVTERADSKALFKIIQQEIAETSELIMQESESIRDLIHKKTEAKTSSPNTSEGEDQTSILCDHFNVLQHTFQEEINKIGRELRLTATTE